MRARRSLFKLLKLSLLALICGLIGGVLGHKKPWQTPEVIARVNQQNITRKQLDQSLQLRASEAAGKLVENALIVQEASRLGVALDKPLGSSLPRGLHPAQVGPYLANLEAEMLLQKLILKDINQTELERFFKTFEAELRLYDLQVFRARKDDLDALQQGLQRNIPFQDLLLSYADDKPTREANGKVGFLNRAQMCSRFGHEVADRVETLNVGEVAGPVRNARGLLFAKLVAKRSTFDDLRPQIEKIFIEAHRNKRLHTLAKQAKIEFLSPAGPVAPDQSEAELENVIP